MHLLLLIHPFYSKLLLETEQAKYKSSDWTADKWPTSFHFNSIFLVRIFLEANFA